METAILPWALRLLGALLVCACGYYAFVLHAARRFHKEGPASSDSTLPPVSILKPVCGPEPDFYRLIHSHAGQDYPEFEILFGVSDPGDPLIPEIRRLAREFPDRRVELFFCETAERCGGGERLANFKVQCLARLAREARYSTLLVDDGDILLDPGALRDLAHPLAAAGTGLVTALYRAEPAGSAASLLEALWVSAEFSSQVLAARASQGMRFALGAAMVLRRETLERIGGFEAIEPFLADDYELGRRVAASGERVVLASHPVETRLPAADLSGVWKHWLRWSRTVRACRPAGHLGLALTQGSVWSLLGLAAAPAAPALGVLAAACMALRLLAGWYAGSRCADSALVRRLWWLLPLADLAGFAVWAAAWQGRRVEWRGREILLGPAGSMWPVEAAGRGERPLPGTVEAPADATSAPPAEARIRCVPEGPAAR